MQVALIQLAVSTDPAENRSRISDRLDRLGRSAQRPDLVVLPEAAMCEYGPPERDLSAVAEDLDGPFVAALGSGAQRLGGTVIAGMFERSTTSPRPYNTVVVVAPDGSLLASYRKIHLFDSFGHRESDQLSPGDVTSVVVPVADRRVGLMTCYDVRFPELARALVDSGADTLCVPAAWVRGPLKESQWSILLRARAIENTAYVIGCGQCGEGYVGLSMVVDPWGVVLNAAGAHEATVTAELDSEHLRRARRTNPALSHRRLGIG